MSVAAMAWVFSQDVRPSQVKFVLLAIADNANHLGLAWPSLESICSKTSQDRKTVIAALDYLESLNLVRDTKERRGETGQIKVYELVGLPSCESHYVYRLENPETGEFYIGVRSCPGDPERDDYMGSGKWPFLMRKAGVVLHKTILAKFQSRAEAEAYEQSLIRDSIKESLCRNRSVHVQKEYRRRMERVPPTDGKSTADGTRNHQEPKPNHQEPPLASDDAKGPPKERAKDPIWDAMLAVCGLNGSKPTPSERGAWNKSAQALRAVDATPSEIQARAVAYRKKWPNVSLTPTSLARRWSECVADAKKISVPPALCVQCGKAPIAYGPTKTCTECTRDIWEAGL